VVLLKFPSAHDRSDTLFSRRRREGDEGKKHGVADAKLAATESLVPSPRMSEAFLFPRSWYLRPRDKLDITQSAGAPRQHLSPRADGNLCMECFARYESCAETRWAA
jgi:hypothetical protein